MKLRHRIRRRVRRMLGFPSPSLELAWSMEQALRRLDLNRIQEDADKAREERDGPDTTAT